MKNATATATVNRVGTLDRSSAETLAIDAEGLSFILDLLSKQYSNPFKAIVREYSCNARDSHVEAGQTRPIEVTLPTPLDPQFRVQDWGVGLSREEILKVSAPYGSSTKRNTTNAIGAFGIGAKSAFAVSNEFMVTGVKDGRKTVALFSRSDEGRPTVQILLDAATGEENGVTVEIGASNVPAVRDAATWLFSHWDEGTVLVDGEAPVTLWSAAEEIDKSNGIYLSWDHQVGTRVKFIMGTVPYDIPNAAISELPGNIQEFLRQSNSTSVTYLIKIPIGAVHITPSREELMITDQTTKTLTHRLTLLTQGIEKWMSRQLDSSANLWEAARFYRKLATQLNYTARANQVKWKGIPLGDDNVRLDYPTFSLKSRSRYNWSASSWDQKSVHAAELHAWSIVHDDSKFAQTLIVTNVPDDKINVVKTYAKEWLFDANNTYTHIIASPLPEEEKGWFSYGEKQPSDIPTIDYADYRTVGLAARKTRMNINSTTRLKTQYSCFVYGETYSRDMTVADIKATGKIPLYHTSGFSNYGLADGTHVLSKVWATKKYIIVSINGGKSVDVFKRHIPSAISLWDVYRAEAEKIFDGQTPTDIKLLQNNSDGGTDYDAGLKFVQKHRDTITNADVLKYVDAAATVNTLTPKQQSRLDLLQKVYQYLSKPTPASTRTSDAEWFRVNLPFLVLALYNRWTTERIFGTPSKTDEVLVEYINSTDVSVV